MNKKIVIQFFHYLWIAMASAIILFVFSQAFYTKRNLVYNLDFSQRVNKDIRGWYPEQRLVFSHGSSLGYYYDVIGEPLYMKIYTPIDFENINIKGTIIHGDSGVELGLKQKDGSWHFKSINYDDFNLDFDLDNAQVTNNQLEIILSIPSITETSGINMANNWQIILSR